ncbi:MAG: DUF86 domain-containing protein [Thermodesulfobacteriota bacterium]
MPRRSDLYLKDILAAAAKARAFTSGLDYAGFVADERTLLAVAKLLEIMGEAAARIPEEVRRDHPAVPWRSIADFRNRLVHQYWGMDAAIIWDLLRNELPLLEREVSAILGSD